jgi:hypothetical protein
LDDDVKNRFASYPGHTLRDVHVHTDDEAGLLTRAMESRAFAVGSDLFFAPGEYRPGTKAGDHLLAHELAHVAQTGGGCDTGSLTVSRPGDAIEIEAENVADRHAAGLDAAPIARIATQDSPILARKPRKGVTTVDFSDEPVVTRLPPEAESPIAEINIRVADLVNKLARINSAMGWAIGTFARDQAFSSSEEGKANYSAVFLSYAGKALLKEALGKLGKEGGVLPGVDKIWELTFGLVEKLSEEDERAAKARGSRAVAEFINAYSLRVEQRFQEQLGEIPALRGSLASEFLAIGEDKDERELGKPTIPRGEGATARPVVAGKAAKFLVDLRSAVEQIRVPRPDECLKTIIEAWVKQSEGKLMSRGGGDIYVDGRILISLDIEKQGERYDVKNPKAKLQAPRAAHVIDSMKGTGKTINEFDILKVLTVDVEDEVFGFNDHYRVRFVYRTPGQPQQITTVPSPVEEETMRKAPGIQRRVEELIKLEQINPKELEPIDDKESRPIG